MPARWHTRDLIGMNAGLLLWSAYFVALYGLMSIGCQLGLRSVQPLGVNLISLVLAVIVIAALAALGWLARAAWRTGHEAQDPRLRFRARVALTLDALSVIATLWVGVPVFMVPPCV